MTLQELAPLPRYVQAFGYDPCVICGKRTPGKAAAWVNVNGGYFDPCVPLCAKCNRERLSIVPTEGQHYERTRTSNAMS